LKLKNYLYLCKYLKIKAIYVTYFHYFGKNKLVLLHENKPFFSLEKINKLFIYGLILLFSTSCAVQKRKDEKDGPIKKLYHNITAHYNAYFNADVLINESIVALSDQYPDNYTKILPVFDYVAADNPQAVASSLDEAIKKVTVVVNLHPESNWSDDCYLLAGKAQYLKQDYESAEETLLYMLKEFSPEAVAQREKDGIKRTAANGKKTKARKKKSTKKDRKKAKKAKEKAKKAKRKAAKKRAEAKKKERERRRKEGKKNTGKASNTKTSKDAPLPTEPPKTLDTNEPIVKEKEKTEKERYLLKHRPAFQEGQLWMARTYIEREAYDEAERIISKLEKDPTTFKDVRRALAPVMAHYHIKQKNYDQAIDPLKKAIELGKDRQLKARYAYILAQIYQKNGDNKASEIAFAQARKFSNSYDMEFSAQLNIIRNSWEAGTLTDVNATKTLQKMTRDIKNYEYRDQIYFLMATIALKDNDSFAAIDYLKLSLQYNEGNAAQKGESYLQLAQLYFDKESFVEAKAYYDSTLQVLPKTDERYDQVNEYADNLTDIAANLMIIQTQDSLLQISNMSDDERRALAYKIKKEEEAAKFKNLKTAAASTKTKSSRPGSTKSNYWAYNEKIRKKGLKDFRKRWGDRQLEDNWRRSTRSELRSLDDDQEIAEEDINRELTDDDIKGIFRDVPGTPADVAKSEKEIAKAMLKLGGLYRDRLQDNEKSIKILEEREQRFPTAESRDEMYYFLYLAHKDLNNTTKAKYYYDKLAGEFPNSSYARVLTDPDFLSKSRAEDQALMQYYDQTYISFEDGKYSDVAQRITVAQKEFGPGNKLQAKFALLGAMSKGSLEGKDAYRGGLREVIGKYPNTPEEVRAKEILKLLGQGAGGDMRTETSKSDPGETGKYKVESEKLHYFIVLITGGAEISLNDAKAAISNYNTEFNKLQKLRISPVSLGDQPMVVIRRFKSQDKAMTYYEGITKNSESFLPSGVEYEIYPITQNNYRTVLKSKSLEGYKEFFEGNYLN